MTSHSILQIESLDIALRSGDAILTGVDLAIAPGKVLGVIGESGAGKSMIGAAIADTLPAGLAISRGSIRFDGLSLTDMTARTRRDLLGRDIGFIPQEPMTALNPTLTVGQQIGRHLARIGIANRATRDKRAIELFSEVGLDRPAQLLKSYPHQLSGGMLQRVLIAMAFASNPRLVIADEPTTALDVTIQAKVVELIARMRQAHDTSVLFITHDLQLAADVCDDVAVLYAGRIVETGRAEEIIDAPRHPYSRCLSLAAPNLDGPVAPLMILPKAMPGAVERAAMRGCAFAPRCPTADEACMRRLMPGPASGNHRHAGPVPIRPGDDADEGIPVQPDEPATGHGDHAVKRLLNDVFLGVDELRHSGRLRLGHGSDRNVSPGTRGCPAM